MPILPPMIQFVPEPAAGELDIEAKLEAVCASVNTPVRINIRKIKKVLLNSWRKDAFLIFAPFLLVSKIYDK